MFIKTGTTIYLSEMGAKGFIYPKAIPTISTQDVEALPLHFTGSPDKEAYLVSAKIISLEEKEKLVVWINKR